MAERIVSPGVYTREVDQSYLPGAIAQIGAAVVGPTAKGPALIPTPITSYDDFDRIFGPINDDSYVPYVVQEYLKNGGPAITVTRLLYEDGYNYQNGVLAIVATSASVETITHILHPTQQIQLNSTAQAANIFTDSVINSGTSGSFEIKISGSYTTNSVAGAVYSLYTTPGASISASINSAASTNNYVTTVFGTDPKSTTYPVYVQYENKNVASLFNNLGAVTVKLVKLSNYPLLSDFSNATTPWITSQKIGSNAINLFKFATLSHGTSVNSEVKIGIRDILTSTEVTDPDGWPTFTVVIRRVNTTNIKNTPYASNDTDKLPDVVETYANVNLNPDSSRYIGRVIGDRYQTVTDAGDILVNGNYPNQSKFVRVIVDDAVANKGNDKTLFPFGSRALTSPVPVSSGSVNLSAVSYVSSQVVSSQFDKSNYHGFDFAVINNLNYLAPTPSSASSTGSNVDFYLGDVLQSSQANYPTTLAPYSGSLSAALTAGTFTSNVSLDTRKFMVPFQGGFDGAAPNLPKKSGANITAANTFGFDCSSASSTGTVAYNKAFALLSNTDYYDINLLITPGIIDSIHGAVTLAARNLVETRQDAFYVMDSNQISDSVTTVTSQVQTLDSNYTACYWPWLRITNPIKNVPVWVPPSVIIPGVLAFTDKNSFPWYAPAGLSRGVLTSVSDTYIQLNQSYRDSLYNARVNPIANFPNNGVVIWGQKTLQARPSALDRVNVRRLLIAVKKYIASATRYLVFEPNSTQTRKRFENIVNPYLESVKNQQGLFAFRVVMDETNNTADLIDQNILYGQLFLQPTRTAEFVILDFNIQPTGASFAQ